PGLLKIVKRSAISGLVGEELVELLERNLAALHVTIGARRLEKIDQLVARHRRAPADVLQHPLVRELDDGVAEVEDEPGHFRHGPHNYIRNTPNRGSSIGEL